MKPHPDICLPLMAGKATCAFLLEAIEEEFFSVIMDFDPTATGYMPDMDSPDPSPFNRLRREQQFLVQRDILQWLQGGHPPEKTTLAQSALLRDVIHHLSDTIEKAIEYSSDDTWGNYWLPYFKKMNACGRELTFACSMKNGEPDFDTLAELSLFLKRYTTFPKSFPKVFVRKVSLTEFVSLGKELGWEKHALITVDAYRKELGFLMAHKSSKHAARIKFLKDFLSGATVPG